MTESIESRIIRELNHDNTALKEHVYFLREQVASVKYDLKIAKRRQTLITIVYGVTLAYLALCAAAGKYLTLSALAELLS